MLTATLTAVVCAILQCCRGYDAIGQWLSEQPLDFLHALGFLRKPPTASGVRKLLSRIDAAALEESLTCWIKDLLAQETPPVDLAPMALDGKSLRGTWNRFDRAVHLLNVIDQRTKCVIHQRLVPGDTNEHKIALEVLKDLVLTGRVLTADAAFCHPDVCQTIVESGGHYVLPVKDNAATGRGDFQRIHRTRRGIFPPTSSVNEPPNVRRRPPLPKGTIAKSDAR